MVAPKRDGGIADLFFSYLTNKPHGLIRRTEIHGDHSAIAEFLGAKDLPHHTALWMRRKTRVKDAQPLLLHVPCHMKSSFGSSLVGVPHAWQTDQEVMGNGAV